MADFSESVSTNSHARSTLVRDDAAIDFEWGLHSPDSSNGTLTPRTGPSDVDNGGETRDYARPHTAQLPADFFSVRWEGLLLLPAEVGSSVAWHIRRSPLNH